MQNIQVEGNTYKETCKVFKISETILTRWIKISKENNLENKAIIMDNASFHRKKILYELYSNSNKNLRLIFLPPYSPELNPI